MNSFIFNSFKDNLLKGNIKGSDNWCFVAVNSEFNKLDENIVKSLSSISDINMLPHGTDELGAGHTSFPMLDIGDDGAPSYSIVNKSVISKTYPDEYKNTPLRKDYVATFKPIYYRYYRTNKTKTADKPMCVGLDNWDEFITAFPNNEHLKKLFLTKPSDLVDPDVGKFYRPAINDELNEEQPRNFYFVRTAEELLWCANTVNGNQYGDDYNNFINIVLGDNIGSTRQASSKNKIIDFCIGDKVNRPFEGIFYGNGFKIQNIELQCNNNSNGLIGYLGEYGEISTVIIEGDFVLKNYKKININHMINDACDVNAALLCGSSCGTISDIYVHNAKVSIKGFVPSVYAVSNKTDNLNDTAFSHPDENRYFPSYLCINSKANIVPYIGYFAEGVHSTVQGTDGMGYWNSMSAYPDLGFMPFDRYSESEWAYPSANYNSATDVTGHVFYYDINTMVDTQSLITNNESDWNSYLSMLPVSTEYDADISGNRYFYDINSVRYSDRSIKMHQFNRVSYNTSIIAGTNYGSLSGIYIDANTICKGTFVGFFGGLAGKYAPKPYKQCNNCCVNITASDTNIREYFNSVETNQTHAKIEGDNRLTIITHDIVDDSCGDRSKLAICTDTDGAHIYSETCPIIQLGLEGKRTDGKKFTVEYLGRGTVSRDICHAMNDYSKLKYVLNSVTWEAEGEYTFDAESMIKANQNYLISCKLPNTNDTYECDNGIFGQIEIKEKTNISHISNADTVWETDFGDEKIVYVTMSDVDIDLQYAEYSPNNSSAKNKIEAQNYVPVQYESKTTISKPIKWVGGKIGKLKLKYVYNKTYFINDQADGYVYNNFEVVGASNIELFGYKSKKMVSSVFPYRVEFFKIKLDNINFTNKIDRDLTSEVKLGYIGFGRTSRDRKTVNQCVEYMINRFIYGKKIVGCKNYYVEKKSIKNIGALFGSWVVRNNSVLNNVSAYLDNENDYTFWETKETGGSPTDYPRNLRDYAFNNRFSSLAAICEVDTDCIGDITENKIRNLMSYEIQPKPINFNNVHLRYNEKSTEQKSDKLGNYTQMGPMAISTGFNLNKDETSEYTCPFGIANPFICEFKYNYIAIPSIIESPLSNIKTLEMDTSACTERMLYCRTGLFTVDQNLASPQNDDMFWSVNTYVDMPGDTIDAVGGKVKNSIYTVDWQNTTNNIELLCDGLDTITLGNFKSNGVYNYGLGSNIWSVYPYAWNNASCSKEPSFTGCKIAGYQMTFGSDIVLKKYPFSAGNYYPEHNQYLILEHEDNPASRGEFYNSFGIMRSTKAKTNGKNEAFSMKNNTVEANNYIKDNIDLSNDPTAYDIFKYTYTKTTNGYEYNMFYVPVTLTDIDDKFGFTFKDVNNDGMIYDDEIIYDGSIIHLGLNANESCILDNLRTKSNFYTSSISADDFVGLLVHDRIYRPIMYIDISNFKFDGTNAWALNCSVNNENLMSAYNGEYGKDHKYTSANKGLILELE